MRMTRCGWLRGVGGLLLAAVIASGGCDDRTSNRGNPTAGSEPGAAGGCILRFVSPAKHHSLDPQKVSWLHDIRIVDCLFDPLVRLTPDSLEIEPATAEAWEISDDGRTYTFHLRADARWSNGDSVTAQDYVYAWRRAMLPDSAADYSQLMFVIDGAEAFFNWRASQLADYVRGSKVGDSATAEAMYEEALGRFSETVALRAKDERTLVVGLKKPTSYFLELCTFGPFAPVHAKSVDSQSSVNATTGMATVEPNWTREDRLIANGPYRLKQWRPDRDLELAVNEQYYGRAAMANRGIVEVFIENPQTALLAYERGQVDWLPDMPTASPFVADLLAQKRSDVHATSAAGTYFYSFNCRARLNDGRPNPLHDARVRRALSMGIDRSTIVQKVTRLNQPEARTFVPVGVLPGYAPPVEAGVGFAPEEAARLLAEAGYPEGRGLEGLSISYNTGAGHETIAQQIAMMWKQRLGVAVTLEAMESKVFGARLKNKDYSIARASWFGDYRDPTTYLDKFVTGNGNNDAAYSNPEFDRLMSAAEMQTDAIERMALLRRAEALMLGDQPIAPIFQYISVSLWRPAQVRNLIPNAWNRHRLELVGVGPLDE